MVISKNDKKYGVSLQKTRRLMKTLIIAVLTVFVLSSCGSPYSRGASNTKKYANKMNASSGHPKRYNKR